MSPQPAITALRARLRARLATAPDHYDLMDRRLIGQLAGLLFIAGGVLTAAVLPLAPPTASALGDTGWAVAIAALLGAFVLGGLLVRTDRILPARLLLLIAVSGPALITILQALAGRDAPYEVLLLLSLLWGGVVLPPRPVLFALSVATLIMFAPLAYDGFDQEVFARRLVEICVVWVITFCSLIWAQRLREIRRELRRDRDQADELARIDALTGLGNRRAFDEALKVELAVVDRSGSELSALIGDLDGFKPINDRFGHHAGDEALRVVAHTIRETVRRPDACFRWGGDEFAILLPGADADEAAEVAARVSATIAARCASPDGTPLSLPFGAATLRSGMTPEALVAEADAALLARKGDGRAGSSPAPR